MPSKFQIYVDQSMRQPPDGQPQPAATSLQPAPMAVLPQQNPNIIQAGDPPVQQKMGSTKSDEEAQDMRFPRYIKEDLGPNMKFYFDERKLYPVNGGEYSFEELNLVSWVKRQKDLILKRRCEEVEMENEELRQRLEAANQQIAILTNALQQIQQTQVPTQTITLPISKPLGTQSPPNARLSIVPQSLQPAQGPDADTSCYGGLNEAPSVVQDWWRHTLQIDKFTVPIDQSQYIRDNVPTSTPNAKEDKNKRTNRRMSRPSMGGSPTMKLSPITETSRDCNSKSSSSSSAMSTTPGTTLKKPLVMQPVMIDEPDRPLDPNDPTTYRKYLKSLAEPLDRRQGYVRINSSIPAIKNGVCFRGGVGGDAYLVDKELSKDAKMYTAQLLSDDSDQSNSDLPVKTICFRVDQPQNDWLFYICNELHRRLVRQKTQPDIELSVMNADPAIMYTDGSILIDEYFRFVTLEDYFSACTEMHKQFPKSIAAYITLELLQLVKSMHDCNIIHMNLVPQNIIITGCPSREDISSVEERTSIVKLIGFDYAADIRLLPCEHKFTTKLNHLVTCDMIDEKPWTYEVDWYGVLACIHRMFFLEPMNPIKEGDRWQVQKHFKGYPTNVWQTLFDQLLNIEDLQTATSVIDQSIVELSTWVKANISFVLKEAACLDMVLEDHCKATNKSVRI